MTQTMKSVCSALALLLAAGAGCGSGSSGPAAPAAPSDLKAEELEGGAHLTWKDNSSDESGFMIERKVGSAAYATLTTVPFNKSEYHDPNLTSGTVYSYHVMAMGKQAGKNSDVSNEVTFTLGAGSSDGTPSSDGGSSTEGDASSDDGHASHHGMRSWRTMRARSVARGSTVSRAERRVERQP